LSTFRQSRVRIDHSSSGPEWNPENVRKTGTDFGAPEKGSRVLRFQTEIGDLKGRSEARKGAAAPNGANDKINGSIVDDNEERVANIVEGEVLANGDTPLGRLSI
jgi:hypothetical protein